MRPLLIDEGVRAKITKLVELAASQPMPLDQVRKMAEKRSNGMMTNPLNDDLTIDIPEGWRVTYTHEHQRNDVVCRHLSVSVSNARKGFGPNPAAVAVLLEEFGFKNKIGEMPAWTTDDDGRTIVEFLEPLDGDINRLRRQ